MAPHWRVVIGCLSAFVVLINAGVVPTQDTLIVARSDESSTPETSTSSTAADVTTEEPSPPIKITEMDVQSQVTMRYAHTSVTTRVRNPAKRAQEATFRVILPETAFISGFVMTIDGKSYKAYVKEKEEAKQIYNDAVSHGYSAAHVSAKARDSNHFTVSVNVPSNSTALFNLTYEEMLTLRQSVYNHAINVNPGTPVPKLSVTVRIKENQKIVVLRVPEIRTGNEIDATESDPQNTKAIIEKSAEGREAVIKFKPDLEEQRRLMEIYAQKSKESMQSKHSHRWYESDDEQEAPEGVLGQFVVQYDVERPKDGEILVNDGYFVHFYAPKELPHLNKYVVFVLDTSGSMMDRKITQLHEAMQTILSDLNHGDYFSIVEFASSVSVHDLKEADDIDNQKKTTDDYSYYNVEKNYATLVPPFQATPENIEKAKLIVSKLTASGGTNIDSALNIALQLVHKGIGWTQSVNASIESVSSSSTTTVPTTTEDELESSNTELANDSLHEDNKPVAAAQTQNTSAEKPDEKKLESMIIFLTDGDPTVGETDPKRIMTHVNEMNYGENKAVVFCLAFGDDADQKFLRKVALRNNGFSRHIYEAADAAKQLHFFFRQITSPLLSHVKFTYPPDQVKGDTLTKKKFRILYDGAEAVVAGKLDDHVTELTPMLSGFCGVDEGFGRKRYELLPRVPVTKVNEYLPLERLWAYLTIKQLLDERDADEASDKPVDKENGPEKKALNLALKYEFVTPLTSLVVVRPNATQKAVNAESVDGIKDFGSAAQFAPASFNSMPGPPGAAGGAGVAAYSIGLRAGGSFFGSGHSYHSSSGGLSYIQPQRINGGGGSSRSRYSYPSRSGLSYIRPHSSNSGGSFFGSRHSYPSSSSGLSYIRPQNLTPGLTTPFNPPAATFLTLNSPIDPLYEYHLDAFNWVRSILNQSSDELELPVNGTTVHLKLSKDDQAPKETSDAECTHATDGAAGLCVYLTRCEAARGITADLYATSYCTINTEYAGVCCPKDKIDQTS